MNVADPRLRKGNKEELRLTLAPTWQQRQCKASHDDANWEDDDEVAFHDRGSTRSHTHIHTHTHTHVTMPLWEVSWMMLTALFFFYLYQKAFQKNLIVHNWLITHQCAKHAGTCRHFESNLVFISMSSKEAVMQHPLQSDIFFFNHQRPWKVIFLNSFMRWAMETYIIKPIYAKVS